MSLVLKTLREAPEHVLTPAQREEAEKIREEIFEILADPEAMRSRLSYGLDHIVIESPTASVRAMAHAERLVQDDPRFPSDVQIMRSGCNFLIWPR